MSLAFNSSMNVEKHIAILKDRSMMLSEARAFFSKRSLVEVDCPMISAAASVDAHIDLIPTIDAAGERRYLHSSPEYGMKRLLVQGIGDCYQLSHVFRQGEYGAKHNPEFMMAEWYRVGMPFTDLINETIDFIRLFVGNLPYEVVSYREVFQRFAGFDYTKLSNQQLIAYLQDREIDVYEQAIEEGRDALLNLILGIIVEPNLGKNGLFVLAYYPSSQAALAKTQCHDEEWVAERFEVYLNGVELANGYHELADPAEQHRRFIEANQMRNQQGKETLPIDKQFLKALEQGLPDCCGVAVGFDRLMMLRHQAPSISSVIPFDWNTA
jgi:elongation factor P--(R)-beta-lysine ligase